MGYISLLHFWAIIYCIWLLKAEESELNNQNWRIILSLSVDKHPTNTVESILQDSSVNHHDAPGADGERMEEGGKEGKGGEEKRKQPVEGAKKSGSSDPSSASSIPDYER